MMTRTVLLRGYPEAILATYSVTLSLDRDATAGTVLQDLTAQFPQLRTALLHDDGAPRQAIKVFANGVPVSHESDIPASGTLTVLATLPCDG